MRLAAFAAAWFILSAAAPVLAQEQNAPTDTWGTDNPLPEDAKLGPSATTRAPCEPCRTTEAAERVPLKYTLEGIEVRGNSKTSTRVVLRYIPFAEGDVSDVDSPALELARFRLLGTGFFRSAEFSLKKGSQRGQVVLVVDVVERPTVVINDISLGLSADADTQGNARPLTAYGGLDVAETNLAGTGITLGAATAVAQNQFALRVRFLDPAFVGSQWMLSGQLLYNDANDFFGNADVFYVNPNQTGQRTDYAVVSYTRFGGAVGVGRDLSLSTQLWVNYRLETIDATVPLAASHKRGFDTEPIDFDIVPGRSVLSTLRGTLQHDTRDHPFLPTRGWHVNMAAEVALLPATLDYSYQRMQLSASRWWKLPWKQHVVRLELFGGAITGDAPFFEQFYVGDFSDFLPDRVLDLNFDSRPPPNFLSTDIVEVRYGDYAFKLGAEYRIPLYRGRRSIYGIDLFGSGGVYGVAGERDLTDPPTGYSGLALIPIDVTANVGFRMDTSAGGFVFAFSNVLGFIPVRGEGPAGK
ncbi:MAG TPA: BamA/TamA family outer membrane protein [Polyangiaceae bacterium]|nr:BamA/TamA family outer membrane protein [Polyangiaceae bacterium]